MTFRFESMAFSGTIIANTHRKAVQDTVGALVIGLQALPGV